MSTIRIVQGTGEAPTAMASYDAALAAAGVENYNLVSVSSVIPADVPVEDVGTAPELGPAGERLTVVEACATTAGPGQVSAALAWSSADDSGPGLFYEVAGETDPEDVENRVLKGLAAGQDLREWSFGEPRVAIEHSQSESGVYTTSLVLAVYGESEPIC
ncbi:pyruvoyl-dependent arginine decarboxylase [Natrialba taiwanensis]|uniref:arginine decarboxylase n=1 Tax=Natrialba taiwanensis DSM 12281 TaxID=1230458 RepID=M0A5T1_9EURY|nr:pyruvoyl-dependent arginine decarboxylase [Natrialba taiwanensis]ELY94090.1 pyruvoyl-dependent arginine decarboxylase [Natrialba taiwanensis DSM 12281]